MANARKPPPRRGDAASASLSRRQLLGAAAALVAIGPAAAAAQPTRREVWRRARRPAHFLFVHGAFHGAWCWYKITAALEAAGHVATAVDLPSGGIDATPALTVTLQAQADRILEQLDRISTPVILVGHSAGGPVISTVAEMRPEKIAKLVYLTAFLLPSGTSIATATGEDPGSLLAENLMGTPDGLVVRAEAVRDVFYGFCDDAEVALARSLLKPIGVQPTITAVGVGNAFASVRRFYIGCQFDHAITADFQQAMYTALPCEKVFTIDTDHSPFLSRPAELVRALTAIARA